MGIEGKFAYDTFRPGQKEFAQRVYDAATGGQTLIAEAMSGFGKTAAVLTGTLSASEETGCKVVYACRTKRQIHRVLDEAGRLQKRHTFKVASILSKFDYCLLRRNRPVPKESFGWYCSFNISNNLCSYFMNVPLVSDEFNHLVGRILHATPTQAELLRESESIHVCPYEVARLAMAQSDVAVAPYHYVFDPSSSSVLFDRNLLDRRKVILVVDEAHNLRDFFRTTRSATLSIDQVKQAAKEAEVLLMEEAMASLLILEEMLEKVLVEHRGWLVPRPIILERFRRERGVAWLQNLAFELNSCSGAAWGSITYERRLPSLILQVGEFLAKLTSGQATLVKWENNFGLIDPNPVGGLATYLREFRSSVLVSATVNPSLVFIRSLGLRPSDVATYEASARPSVEVKTAIDVGVSTRYRLRSPEMFTKISDRVATVIRTTREGVGVFVPSYSLLKAIFDMVSRKVDGRNLVAEAAGMSNQEAADTFDSFRSADDSVLFGVQGGRFSEGEDFSGDSMGAVIVVGLSLPPPSPMLYAEYACLKQAGEPDSFLMLSRLPALRKAFQAAGRHIRRPGKRGLVIFMDERFGSDAVRNLMPSWLRKDLVIGDLAPQALGSLTNEFWASPGLPPLPS